MIPVQILGTSSLLPGRAVSTEELASAVPGRGVDELIEKTGIRSRHWIPKGARSAPIGAEVLRRALDDAQLSPEELRRIIFVSTAGGDSLVPANANHVAALLGIDGTSDAFDLNNACLGFLTAFDLGARCSATGLSPVAIVVVEIFSDLVTPEDPRPYLVAGDAAAAVILGPGRPSEGLLSVHLGNKGALGGTVTLEHPRFTRVLERGGFATSNRQMSELALELILKSTERVLTESNLHLSDIEWVLPHQPNGAMFDAIVKALGVPREKTVPVVQEIGTTGAAAIPVSLDRLLRAGKVKPGDRILMVSVGTGVPFGAMIYKVGTDAPWLEKRRSTVEEKP